jgi:prepilin-type N-terminal cleavage/methylation domain-containing protein
MRSKPLPKIALAEHGFSLVELSVVMVIVGLLIGGAMTMSQVLMAQSEYKANLDKLTEMRERLLGYALSNQRLPAYASLAGTDELSGVVLPMLDNFGRKLVYIYDPQLVRSDVTSIVCAKKTTALSVRYCDDLACTAPTTQSNVAFVAFSVGKNGVNQTASATSPHTEPSSYSSYSGPDGSAGAVRTITLYARGAKTGIFSATSTSPSENDDAVTVVTLEELRSRIACQGVPVRIVNTDLPMGARSTAYLASIFAEGGVPVVGAAGKYRWCVETSISPTLTLTTIVNIDVIKTDGTAQTLGPAAVGACLAAQEGSWGGGDSLRIKGAGASNALNTTTAGTYDITIYVRDDQNADASITTTTDPLDNIVFRKFVLAINGS